ncbi:unnamed protein product [Peniophora sp. CBMAI 1063]|nr:unnamed protein product [Peniophora sp. CBMAI 1063]
MHNYGRTGPPLISPSIGLFTARNSQPVALATSPTTLDAPIDPPIPCRRITSAKGIVGYRGLQTNAPYPGHDHAQFASYAGSVDSFQFDEYMITWHPL